MASKERAKTETDKDTEDKMALNVYTSKCAPDAEIRSNGQMMYDVGVALMVLGLDEITDKNLSEVEVRWSFYCTLHTESPDYRKRMLEMLIAAKGVEINGHCDTWLQFSKRLCENFHRNTLRAIHYRKANEAPFKGGDDELDPAEWESAY